MEAMKDEDPMARIFALGRAKRALKNYQDQDDQLSPFDKRLLKGFYTKDKWELVNSSEEESLKFSAKIDRGRVKGLINHYLTNKDGGLTKEEKEAAKQKKSAYAGKLHKMHDAFDPNRTKGYCWTHLKKDEKKDENGKVINVTYYDQLVDFKTGKVTLRPELDCWDAKFDDMKVPSFEPAIPQNYEERSRNQVAPQISFGGI